MCYDKEKNGKESYNHGKMDEKIIDNDLQPVDRGYVDLNAGKASPEEADDAEETETGEDTLDADAHEGKED